MDLLYIDDLKVALTELGKIDQSLKDLKLKKDALRERIHQWLLLNKLVEHTILDSENENLWKIEIFNQTRKNIDAVLVEAYLTPEQFQEVCKKTEIEVFKCQATRKSSSKSSKLKAPKG